MSPSVSPRYVAERGRRFRNAVAGIAIESSFALLLLGLGYLLCLLAAGA